MLNTTAKHELSNLGNTNQWHKYLHLHGEQTHLSVYSMWNKKYNFTEPRGTMYNQHSDDWTNKAARGNRYFQSRSPPMKMLSELLALCERYTAVTGWFPYWRVSNAGLWYFLFSNPNNCWTHLELSVIRDVETGSRSRVWCAFHRCLFIDIQLIISWHWCNSKVMVDQASNWFRSSAEYIQQYIVC